MSLLHSPLTLRGTTIRNRAWVASMCLRYGVRHVTNFADRVGRDSRLRCTSRSELRHEFGALGIAYPVSV